MKTWVQVDNLGGDPRKHCEKVREVRQEEERSPQSRANEQVASVGKQDPFLLGSSAELGSYGIYPLTSVPPGLRAGLRSVKSPTVPELPAEQVAIALKKSLRQKASEIQGHLRQEAVSMSGN